MFKRKINIDFVEAPPKLDASDVKVLAVDQFPQQDFNKGMNGFTRRDIAIALDNNNQELQLSMLSRLQETSLPASKPDLTDVQRIKQCFSRYAQTPAEVDRYIEYYLRDNPPEQPKSAFEDSKLVDVEEPKPATPVNPVEPSVS